MTANLKQLMTGIESQLDGNVTGFAIAIYQSGTLKLSTSGGWAVINEKKFDSRVRASMGSMGKTISAAAIVQALHERGKSIDDAVHHDLAWKGGPNAKKLTYRMVLTHTTGLSRDQPTRMKDLRARFENGLPALPAKHTYSNANFDLTRILLPALRVGEQSNSLAQITGDDRALGKEHIRMVKRSVLEPCGLGAVDVVYTGPEPALAITPASPTRPCSTRATASKTQRPLSVRAGGRCPCESTVGSSTDSAAKLSCPGYGR